MRKFVWALAILGILVMCQEVTNRVCAAEAARTQVRRQQTFTMKVDAAKVVTVAVKDGEGTDHILGRAGWDRTEMSESQWTTLRTKVCLLNHQDPENPNWQVGTAKVPACFI